MALECFTFVEWVTGYRRRAVKVNGTLYDGVLPRVCYGGVPHTLQGWDSDDCCKDGGEDHGYGDPWVFL
jgi:hypothetical protein